jgi:phosphopantothenoylcysteine decarboxylase/phosphopantothenate--cysteine ligase
MLDAVMAALPADVAVMAAAVADWRAALPSGKKVKKGAGAPTLSLAENPDVLAAVAAHQTLRPKLVVRFAAETDDLLANAAAKLKKKGADWIVANDVSPEGGVMGGDQNTVHILRATEGRPMVEDWPKLAKSEVAGRLVAQIAEALRQ